jgi:hypothetical protein
MTDQPYQINGERASAAQASRQMINDASANLAKFNGSGAVAYEPGLAGALQQQTGILASIAESLLSLAVSQHERVFENPPAVKAG